MADVGPPPALLPNYARDRLTINAVLQGGTNFNRRERMQSVFNLIVEAETQDGTSYLCAQPEGEIYMVVRALGGEIVHLPKHGRGGDPIFSYLYQRYGLSEREDYTRFIYDTLRLYAARMGDRVTMRRFAVFDKETRTSYVSRYDGTMWKLTGEATTIEDNGTDKVFFLDDDGGVPCSNVEIAAHDLLISTLTNLSFADTPGGVTHEQQKMAMIAWIFAVMFPDLLPTKPLLLVEGAPGSGKTSAIQCLQLVLMGVAKPMVLQKGQEDEFGLLLLRSPIALFDNLDSYMEWLPDAVCAYATRGVWPKRKLYTDDQEVTIRPHAFIAVASKNPASFRREDTADRCIILRLERRTEFVRQEQLELNIATLRGKLLGEYLYYANKIIAAIRTGLIGEDGEIHRMADFSYFARVVGQVLGWDESAVAEMITSLQAERDAFIMEEDSLVEILAKWITYKPHNAPSNIGREIICTQLFKELETISQAQGLPFYKSHRMLAQKIRSPHIERDFVVMTSILNGQKAYKIWRHSDGQLRSVTASDGTKGA